MSVSGTEPLLDPTCTIAAAQRRVLFRDGRLWLSLRTVLVALQVACVTLVAWVGATLTLLPLLLRGAPIGRRVVWAPPRRVVRLMDPAPRREAVPR